MTQLTITKPQVLKANRNCQTITFKIEIVLEIKQQNLYDFGRLLYDFIF